MKSDILRMAAKLLLGQAELATAGKWRGEPVDGQVWAPGNREKICTTSSFAYGADAKFIAMMDPTVGLALSQWLMTLADRVDEVHDSLPFTARLSLSSLNLPGIEQAVVTAEALLASVDIANGGDPR